MHKQGDKGSDSGHKEKAKANVELLYADDHIFPRKYTSLLGQIRVL